MRRTKRALTRAVILIPLFLVVGAPRTCGECNVAVNTGFDEQALVMDIVTMNTTRGSAPQRGTATLTPSGQSLFRTGVIEVTFTVDTDPSGAFTASGNYDFTGQIAVDGALRDAQGHGTITFTGHGPLHSGIQVVADGKFIERRNTQR